MLAGQLFARMPLIYLVVIIMECTGLKMLPWQLIQLGKDMAELAGISLKDGNEPHVGGTTCGS